tara:strand:+ start:3561 stop:3905 length:345 start_codon:yes stop_codon:yes gene_type:complete
MLINEVIAKENTSDFASSLLAKVQDILAIAMKRDIKKVSTKKFIHILSKNGYTDISIDQLKLAVDQSGWSSSIDDTTIVPKDELGADIDTEEEPSVDVGAMAGNQALSDIKADL